MGRQSPRHWVRANQIRGAAKSPTFWPICRDARQESRPRRHRCRTCGATKVEGSTARQERNNRSFASSLDRMTCGLPGT